MIRHASHLHSVTSSDVTIPPLGLAGILNVPKGALGLVVFALAAARAVIARAIRPSRKP
jgi:hypothetical protein